MKRPVLALCIAGIAALGLSACADGYYGGGPRGGVAYYEHGPVGFDGYYDDAYGPFYDGYWGDGGFYYSTGEGRPYQLDSGNHFRHENGGNGFHAFHGGMHSGGGAPGAHVGGGEHPHP